MTDEQKMQLLPCPWCGSHKVGTRGRCIECASCGASGPELPLGGTHKDMDALWNTRQAAVAWMDGEGEAVGEVVRRRGTLGTELGKTVVFEDEVDLPVGTKLYTHPPRADTDARDAARNTLRFAASVIELYDEAVMQDEYMIDSDDCAEILRALADQPVAIDQALAVTKESQ
jgi:hypothetical protein